MLFVIEFNKIIYKFTAFLLFFSTVCSTAIAKSTADFSQKGDQISYFKSPNSAYPSGESTLEKLSENLSESPRTEQTYYLYKNQKISKQLIKTLTASDLSNSQNLRDIGFFQTLKKTAFRLRPEFKSNVIQMLPAETRINIISFKDGFILTEIRNIRGYVDISDCISKFDFAKAVYAKHPKTNIKQWFYVKTRSFDQIETIDKQMIPLQNVEGIFSDPTKAIVSKLDQNLPLWTTLEIKSESTETVWLKSRIKGHGFVYWQKPNTNLNSNLSSKNQLKIDDLLKREISFVSFDPKNPRHAIASANGLFITKDGENWTEISQFKNYQGPVLFYSEYLIFAGNYKSIDGGQTFENYIQIEKIAEAIAGQVGFDPKKLQVKKLKPIKPFKLEVEIDIGTRTIKVQTPIYNQDWKVVRI